jgi:hypothetical protein
LFSPDLDLTGYRLGDGSSALRRPEKETDFPTMNKLGYGRKLFGIVTA